MGFQFRDKTVIPALKQHASVENQLDTLIAYAVELRKQVGKQTGPSLDLNDGQQMVWWQIAELWRTTPEGKRNADHWRGVLEQAGVRVDDNDVAMALEAQQTAVSVSMNDAWCKMPTRAARGWF